MMKRFLGLTFCAALSCALASAAYGHAFLDRAIPGVGATVTGAPGELRLSFTQDIVLAFSGVQVTAVGGGAIPAGKPILSAPNVLSVSLGHALKPGAYRVTWHVVSVDTHASSGAYQFTVTP
jgi:methionine-rich copper-binding protein CopC